MGELSLELKPTISSSYTYMPKPLNIFLGEVSRIGNVSEKLDRVDGYVRCLEEEMKKIDAFKRELPLCMLLLNDAIRVLKCETMHLKGAEAAGDSVVEKSVPCCRGNENNNDLKDKKNWMSSVQLWTSNVHSKTEEKPIEERVKEHDRSESIIMKNGGGGGAFVPFRGYSGYATVGKENEKENGNHVVVEPSLSLLTPGIKKAMAESNSYLISSKSCDAGSRDNNHSSVQHIPLQSQASRKQRRCWSPDLHRRFLGALQQLGGSQAATPKQIRELMKVDGLTNDEVKSHLQKYRLHNRRYPAGANGSPPDNQKLVLFGGIYDAPELSATSKSSNTQSESPQGPLQLMGTSGGTSTTGGDDSMDDEEEEEDGKSNSYNWKGQF